MFDYTRKLNKKEKTVNTDQLDQNKAGINESFNSLFSSVDNLISEMKLLSSEEILNGSVVEAQRLLGQILPYQQFYEKLKETKKVFDDIDSIPKSEIESTKEKPETLDQEKINEELEALNAESEELDNDSDITSQNNFRIPILKALIYLGGSSEEVEVTQFVQKEMKNKLTKKDLEILDGADKELWLNNLYFETATMVDEGLLTKEENAKNWEIAQKGLDYLSKYSK